MSVSPHSWWHASRNVAAGVVAFSGFTCLVDAVQCFGFFHRDVVFLGTFPCFTAGWSGPY